MFVLSLTVSSLSLSLISILRLREWRQCLIIIWRLQTQVTIWRKDTGENTCSNSFCKILSTPTLSKTSTDLAVSTRMCFTAKVIS